MTSISLEKIDKGLERLFYDLIFCIFFNRLEGLLSWGINFLRLSF